MPNEMDSLYREVVLEHARAPRNFRTPDDSTHTASGINAVCGDHIDVFFSVQETRIVDAAFAGTGCAICLASASLLTEEVCGMTVDAAVKKSEVLQSTLRGHQNSDDLGQLGVLCGVSRYPSRVQCATLAWRALQDAVGEKSGPPQDKQCLDT